MTFTPNNPNGYVTRMHKLPVRILATDIDWDKPIVAAYKDDGSREYVAQYYANGRMETTSENDFDLIDKPFPVTKWINIYPGWRIAGVYTSQDKADYWAEKTRIACVPVTYTDWRSI